MKVNDRFLGAIADDDEEASFFLLDAISNERGNARVNSFARHLQSVVTTLGSRMRVDSNEDVGVGLVNLVMDKISANLFLLPMFTAISQY